MHELFETLVLHVMVVERHGAVKGAPAVTAKVGSVEYLVVKKSVPVVTATATSAGTTLPVPVVTAKATASR